MKKVSIVIFIIAFICISTLLFLGWRNHCIVNNNCKLIIENVSICFDDTKSIIENAIDSISKSPQHKSLSEDTLNQVSKELVSLQSSIESSKHELIQQKTELFDSNAITFLISFLSALMFTGFISLFIKSAEQYEKVEKKINVFFNKKTTTLNTFYTNYTILSQILNSISILAAILSSNGFVIQSGNLTLVYMIEREIRKLRESHFGNIRSLSSDDKSSCLNIITDSISYLNIQEIRNNNDNGLKAFEDLNNNLMQIREIIEGIPVDED